MSKKTFAILLVIALIPLLATPSMTNESATPAELERSYNAYVDDFISKCESKKELRESGSEGVSREAALYCLKACFLKVHKKELISSMIAEHIGTDPDKIHYHLNRAFFDVLREAIKSRDALQHPQ